MARIGATVLLGATLALVLVGKGPAVPLPPGQAPPRPRAVFPGHTDHVCCVAFADDGKLLASGGFDKTVRLWDVPTGKELAAFEHLGVVWTLAFVPHSPFLVATAGNHIDLKVWDVTARKEIATLSTNRAGSVLALVTAPDGQTLATASADGKVRLWDLTPLQQGRPPLLRTTLKAYPHGWATGVAFDRSGKRLVSVGTQGPIQFWDPQTGAAVATLTDRRNYFHDFACVAFAPDDQTLVTGTHLLTKETSGALKLWDVAARQVTATLEEQTAGFRVLAVSPDGRLLATADAHGWVRLWDLATRTERTRFRPPGGALCLAFDPTGRVLATGCGFGGGLRSPDKRGQNVQLWDVDQLLEQQPAK